MSTNFQAILGRSSGDAKKPKALPTGSYLCIITKHEFGNSSQKKTPFVRFFLRPVQPMQDVDPEMLEMAGGLTEKSAFRTEFYFTEDAEWRLAAFLHEHLGLPGPDSWANLIPQTTNQQVIAHIIHETNDKGDVFARVGETARPS